MINPLTMAQHLAATPTAQASAATSAASSSSTPNSTANSAEAAFMSLLVTELKSQDPTSPMDPTQMVGQMLSMNQLNALLAINETLQNAFGMSAPTSGATHSLTTTSLTGAH
jgi:flagellar basal-body rod modification protein FlgD